MYYPIEMYKKELGSNFLTKTNTFHVAIDNQGFGLQCFVLKNVSQDKHITGITISSSETLPSGVTVKMVLTKNISVPLAADYTTFTDGSFEYQWLLSSSPDQYINLGPQESAYLWIIVDDSRDEPSETSNYINIPIDIDFTYSFFNQQNTIWFPMHGSAGRSTIYDLMDGSFSTSLTNVTTDGFGSVDLRMDTLYTTTSFAWTTSKYPILAHFRTINTDSERDRTLLRIEVEDGLSATTYASVYIDSDGYLTFAHESELETSVNTINMYEGDHVLLMYMANDDFYDPIFYWDGYRVNFNDISADGTDYTPQSFNFGHPTADNPHVLLYNLMSFYDDKPLESTIYNISRGLIDGR